jgi:hypothetical protein
VTRVSQPPRQAQPTWAAPAVIHSAGTSAGVLNGVSSLSHSAAWAAGYFSTSSGEAKTLVLHWNGAGWTEVASPSPGGAAGTALSGVDAVSAANVWAVGSTAPFRGVVGGDRLGFR